MANFTIDPTKTILGLLEFETRSQIAFTDAVKQTARSVMIRVLDRIPKPPTPAGQVYQRTGRLLRGYGPAANFLGLSAPSSTEGSYSFSSNPAFIEFRLV